MKQQTGTSRHHTLAFFLVMSQHQFIIIDAMRRASITVLGDVQEIDERMGVAFLPASSILQKYDNFETVTNKFHFDFRFL